jgi:hypothetical protein
MVDDSALTGAAIVTMAGVCLWWVISWLVVKRRKRRWRDLHPWAFRDTHTIRPPWTRR